MSMSMMGSGIYSQDVDIEIVCAERCYDCEDKSPCKAVFKVNLTTDDWGNIDEYIYCEKCDHNYRYREEKHYD
jgi:hypothetical protein